MRQLFKTREETEVWLKKMRVRNYTINEDLSVDVDGSVNISSIGLKAIPVSFNTISEDFYCHYNQLTSLEGAPQSVGGDFYCRYNELTTLEGGPQSVGGDFDCSNNRLTSLKGGPQSVGVDFYCHYNQLTSLKGGPEFVGADFFCHKNRALGEIQDIKEWSSIKAICMKNEMNNILDNGWLRGKRRKI